MESTYRIIALVVSAFSVWGLAIVGFVTEPEEYYTPHVYTITHVENDSEKSSEFNQADYIDEQLRSSIGRVIELNESETQENEVMEEQPTNTETEQPVVLVEEGDIELNTDSNEAKSTTAFILSVPFTSQAPEGLWGEPWQEACEEASLVMAAHYFTDKQMSVPVAVDEIFTLVEYQTEQGFNYHDSTMEQTGAMGQAIYGLVSEVVTNPTVEMMKQELQNGHPIIAPFAGRLLGNSHFTPPGPRYHVNIIIGFDEATKEFIVHDPGTQFGAHYRYTYDTIMFAMHDWTGNAATIEQGAKRVLIVKGASRAGSTN